MADRCGVTVDCRLEDESKFTGWMEVEERTPSKDGRIVCLYESAMALWRSDDEWPKNVLHVGCHASGDEYGPEVFYCDGRGKVVFHNSMAEDSSDLAIAMSLHGLHGQIDRDFFLALEDAKQFLHGYREVLEQMGCSVTLVPWAIETQ
jgi:hypothetical protein